METEADRSTEAGIGFAERGQPTHLTGSSSSGSSSAISLAYPACFSLTDLDGPASAAAALSFCSLAISSSSSVAGGASPLNRSVVRFGDAFVVHDEDTRKAILVERNAPTPTSLIEGDHQLAEALEALPPHRTNRKSLIANAIEASDRAREARRAGTD